MPDQRAGRGRFRWWRWAVVTNESVTVCNMAPAMPFTSQPNPPGFRSWQEPVVKVRGRHRSRRAAERHAVAWRRGAREVGWVGLAHAVEVWSREAVEAVVQPETVRVVE